MERSLLSSAQWTSISLTGALCVLGFAVPTPLAAQDGSAPNATSDSPEGQSAHLSYRLWGQQRDEILFNPDQRRRTSLVYQRLRISYDQSAGLVRGVAEADLTTGVLAGSPPTVRPSSARTGTSPTEGVFTGTAGWFRPRRAFVEYRAPDVGFAKLGLQTSHWGLGLVAHDGTRDDTRLFNHYFGGDRYLRAMTGFSLLNGAGPGRGFSTGTLTAAIGGDLVYRDEWASLRSGDRAGRGLIALIRQSERTRSGTYAVVRNQQSFDGNGMTTVLVDLFAEHLWSAPGGWDFRAGAEGAIQTGTRRRVVDARDRREIGWIGTGAVGEFEANYRPENVRVRLRTGIASGDANRSDDTASWFRFDPNYQVGLVLFDYYLPAVTRESYGRWVDPRRAGSPPVDASSIVNDGAVENAMYVNPMVLLGDTDGWMGGLGVVGARSPQPWSDPVQSFQNGGVPTGLSGESPPSRHLGWEVDAATRYRHELPFELTLDARAEFGILFPGAAFRTRSGAPVPPVSLLRLSLGGDW